MGYNFGPKDAPDSGAPVPERFFYREADKKHKKSIAHSATSREGYNAHIAFSEWNQPIEGVRLHHYGIKTLREYRAFKVKKEGYMQKDYAEADYDSLARARSIIFDPSALAG